ncbi:class I SAM-dependent methyltransferase [Vaginella massiliensis]|uniref:class I SAM-dependent methyltransferase n=1 Tax=Vaginella massiliensis TaxID=1816680 RepID=UPI000838F8CE|nr:class I SAM-dependent methyltransferase [Vaginella massiliensis]
MKVKDYFLTQEEFELKEDPTHGMLCTQPIPSDFGKYYESEKYISHTDGKKSVFEKLYQLAKSANLKAKYKVVERHATGKKILDYGCGVGDFLAYMKQKGFEVEGFEPNATALEIARRKLGNLVTNESIIQRKQQYDVITLWHVLEHIPNRDEIFQSLIDHLTPDGILVVALPNHNSYDAKFYGKYWAAYDVPRHLWHFDPESMKRYVSFFGMKIEIIYPQYFDSLYVGILSEKYQKNQFAFLRGVYLGLISNYKAKKTKQFSSLIYMIKKDQK